MSDDNFTPATPSGVPPTSQAVPPAPNPYSPPPPYPGPPAAAGVQQPALHQPYPPQQTAQPYAPPQPYAPGQPYAPAQPYAPPRPTSGLAVASLITGIGGIVLSWTFVMLLASIVAVITGHMALNQLRRTPTLSGRGMAIAGVILGYVGVAIIALSILIGILSFVFIGSIGFLPFFLS